MKKVILLAAMAALFATTAAAQTTTTAQENGKAAPAAQCQQQHKCKHAQNKAEAKPCANHQGNKAECQQNSAVAKDGKCTAQGQKSCCEKQQGANAATETKPCCKTNANGEQKPCCKDKNGQKHCKADAKADCKKHNAEKAVK